MKKDVLAELSVSSLIYCTGGNRTTESQRIKSKWKKVRQFFPKKVRKKKGRIAKRFAGKKSWIFFQCCQFLSLEDFFCQKSGFSVCVHHTILLWLFIPFYQRHYFFVLYWRPNCDSRGKKSRKEKTCAFISVDFLF